MDDRQLMRRARRRQTQRLAWAAGLGVALVLVTAVVIRWHESTRAPSDRSLASLLLLALPVGLLGVLYAAILLARRSGVRRVQPSPSLALDGGQRRRLVRAIRSGDHQQGRDEELALDLARRMARSGWLVVLVPTPAVLSAVVVLARGVNAFGLAVLAAALLSAGLVSFAWRDARRARRYLRPS